MTNPRESSSFRYTIRLDTRPEGRDAVDRVQVSGTVEARDGSLNQLWNWVKGEVGSRAERCRGEEVNWAAREGGWWDGSVLVVVVEEAFSPGAKMSFSFG